MGLILRQIINDSLLIYVKFWRENRKNVNCVTNWRVYNVNYVTLTGGLVANTGRWPDKYLESCWKSTNAKEAQTCC